MKRLERPSQETLEQLSRKYGKLKLRTVDVDIRPAPAPMTPLIPHGYVILVAHHEERGIAVVRHADTPGGIFSFPMRPMRGKETVEEVGRRVGREELGLEVAIDKVPALHIGRFQFKDQEVERWHFVAVGRVKSALGDVPLEPGTEVTFAEDPMSLPHWKESDWYYWILRDAELHGGG